MFEKNIERKNTNSAKWEEAIIETKTNNPIVLTVADMDFATAPNIIKTIVQTAQYGIFGYTNLSSSYKSIVKTWMQKNYNWNIEKKWVVFCPRIIQAISLIIQNSTNIGDSIMIQSPFYSPLKEAIVSNKRKVIINTLKYKQNSYEMDFNELEKQFSKGVKIFILCSPHNPIGRVWDEEELIKLADLCLKYDVLIISDEVHADFTFSKKHIPLGKIHRVLNQTIICTSPAKTFNLPGLEIANIIIPNHSLREKFKLNLRQVGFHNPNYFAVPVLEEAYTNSDNWIKSLKEYLIQNYNFVSNYVMNYLPDFKVIPSEGTYLMWIDYRASNLNEEEIKRWFYKHADVAVSMGSTFGKDGEGFIRINIATPRSNLKKALNRIVATRPYVKER